MAGIASMVERSRATAQNVSTVAIDMQATSLNLCGEIPEIVRNAVTADLREHPRYDVDLRARLDYNGSVSEVAVRDISEGGARIGATRALRVGGEIALTLPGMKPIAGRIIRADADNCGISFSPSLLRAEELRDLVIDDIGFVCLGQKYAVHFGIGYRGGLFSNLELRRRAAQPTKTETNSGSCHTIILFFIVRGTVIVFVRSRSGIDRRTTSFVVPPASPARIFNKACVEQLAVVRNNVGEHAHIGPACAKLLGSRDVNKLLIHTPECCKQLQLGVARQGFCEFFRQ